MSESVPPEAPPEAPEGMPNEQPEGSLDNIELKRERFQEAGRFPLRRALTVGVVVGVVVIVAAVFYFQHMESLKAGGVQIMDSVDYSASEMSMTTLTQEEVRQDGEGISFPLDSLLDNYVVGLTYQRESLMPEGYQLAAGGNILPLLAYVTPSGRLAVGTAFCEPCRSTRFHIAGNELVCDVCYTRWDLNTLMGVGGGCFDYPPEEVDARLQGDRVLVPRGDLESWVPRAYEDTDARQGDLSTEGTSAD